jgi:pimeloyl-ACP methyl ester carboxylesterase
MNRRSLLVSASAALTGLALGGPSLIKTAAAAEARDAALPEGSLSKFASANGIRMHYVTAGNGPALVLLHGWPETWYSWHGVMPRLAKRFTVVAPDLRGVGLTERTPDGYDKKTIAADIAALIEHLGSGKVYLAGHDMGGKAAYVLAHTRPELLSKLVLVDCLLPGTENMDPSKGGAWHYGFHMAAEFPEMLTSGREREYIAAQIRTWSHRKDAISDATIDEYARHYATPGGMTAGFNYYRALRTDIPYAETLRSKKIAIPVLTIAGRYGVGEKLHTAVSKEADDVQGVIAENPGHFVAEEDSEFFCEQIERFCSA